MQEFQVESVEQPYEPAGDDKFWHVREATALRAHAGISEPAP